MKPLDNTNIAEAKAKQPDIKTFGDGDTWRLICKASSAEGKWMKSTKAMEIPGAGCLVQVTTERTDVYDRVVIAEALTFVPSVCIEEMIDDAGQVVERRLVPFHPGQLIPAMADRSRWARERGIEQPEFKLAAGGARVLKPLTPSAPPPPPAWSPAPKLPSDEHAWNLDGPVPAASIGARHDPPCGETGCERDVVPRGDDGGRPPNCE